MDNRMLCFYVKGMTKSFLRILPQQNTALLSHVSVSVRRRDMIIYANIYRLEV